MSQREIISLNCMICYSLKVNIANIFSSDIDECDDENNNCDQGCLNTVGSYSCACEIGYRLDPFNSTCRGKYF